MKQIILFFFSFFLFTSCVFNNKSEGHFDKMIQGIWQVNTEPRLMYVENDSFKIEHLFNVLEHKGYFVNNSIPDDPPRWVWEDRPEHELSIHWYSDGKEGDMKYLHHVFNVYDNETMVVYGFPFSKNEIDTLYRVKNLNK